MYHINPKHVLERDVALPSLGHIFNTTNTEMVNDVDGTDIQSNMSIAELIEEPMSPFDYNMTSDLFSLKTLMESNVKLQEINPSGFLPMESGKMEHAIKEQMTNLYGRFKASKEPVPISDPLPTPEPTPTPSE